MCYGVILLLIAGVPITRPVGGVACGLITSSAAEDPDKQDIEQYRLLTDILVRALCSLKWFSIECRRLKTKTKVITLANHKGPRQSSEPIKPDAKRGKTCVSASRLILVLLPIG